MSNCENLDGQCAKSWCNCDEVRARGRSVRFEIETAGGNRAIINGNPNMSAKTRLALSEMIDAAVKAANEGKLARIKEVEG